MKLLIPRMQDWARRARRRPLVLAMLLTSLLFAIVLAIDSPAYETNDDVVMSMIASGTGVCLSPDEHLVFSHVSIGLVLKELYTLVPDFPWYGAYLLGAQFLSQLAIVYAMLIWQSGLRAFRGEVLAALPLDRYRDSHAFASVMKSGKVGTLSGKSIKLGKRGHQGRSKSYRRGRG